MRCSAPRYCGVFHKLHGRVFPAVTLKKRGSDHETIDLNKSRPCLRPVPPPSLPATAQTDPNPAMNAPDQIAWQLFIQANTSGQAEFHVRNLGERHRYVQAQPAISGRQRRWRCVSPQFCRWSRTRPQRAGGCCPRSRPMSARARRVAAQPRCVQFHQGQQPVQGQRPDRRIRQDHYLSGRRHRGQGELDAGQRDSGFTNGRVTLARRAASCIMSIPAATASNMRSVSMHIISKAVPNWTWATFEHQFNPRRCDIIGCRDASARRSCCSTEPEPGQGYPACAKTPALAAMIGAANIDPAFDNYCLKGSQIDFTDNSGLDVRLGNSVTEIRSCPPVVLHDLSRPRQLGSDWQAATPSQASTRIARAARSDPALLVLEF